MAFMPKYVVKGLAWGRYVGAPASDEARALTIAAVGWYAVHVV